MGAAFRRSAAWPDCFSLEGVLCSVVFLPPDFNGLHDLVIGLFINRYEFGRPI